jgi:hypothetical protein
MTLVHCPLVRLLSSVGSNASSPAGDLGTER